MNRNSIYHWIQTHLKMTKSEINFAVILLIATATGLFINSLNESQSKDIVLSKIIQIDNLEATESIETKPQTSPHDSNIIPLAKTEISSKSYNSKITPEEAQSDAFQKIDLNTADLKQLMRLPGVGEKTAQKIIEYRSADKFESIAEIMNVKGIGPAKFEKMKKFITIK